MLVAEERGLDLSRSLLDYLIRACLTYLNQVGTRHLCSEKNFASFQQYTSFRLPEVWIPLKVLLRSVMLIVRIEL